MANIHDCLDRAVSGGELNKTRAKEAAREFDQLVERYETVMPRHQAEATALAHLKEASKGQALSRRHKVINQLQAMVRMKTLIEGADDPALAIRDLIEHSETSGFTGESVRSLADAMMLSVNHTIRDVLKRHNRDLLGNSRDKAGLKNIMRELHGQKTGDAEAAALADAVNTARENLRQSFNAHGGDIGKLSNYGVQHTHDPHLVNKAGFDEWARFVHDRLDYSRITDFQTGKTFSSDPTVRPDFSQAERFLREVYDGISTRGWNKKDPSMSVGGKAMYNRHAEHRVLHFRDGDTWMEYNAQFGASDPFSSMIGGLHGMAREIAQMRVLGPNPKLGLEYAIQVAEKRVAGNAKASRNVRAKAQRTRNMMAHFDGSVNQPENEAWARFFSDTRKAITSAKLGSAILSAPTDLATVSMASKVVGMKPSNVLSRAVELAAKEASRENAARMGYVAETLADTGSAAARFTAEQMSSEVADRLTSFTIRASGLSYWTDMLKTSFRMEFAGYLADNANRAFDEIDGSLRNILSERGITAKDWDLLRDPSGRFVTDSGADFIAPLHWLEHQTSLPRTEAEGLAMRLQMLIEEQLEFAVPSMRLEGRAMVLGNSQPGTFGGELLRSTTMFKGFALSLTIGQYRRFAALPTTADKAIYAAQMAAGLFVLGALSVQLKQIAKGNDPRPMDNKGFAAAALMQGGGLGIFGDFFASETSRFGGGLEATLAGPAVGFGSDLLNIPLSNAARLAAGENTFVGRDVSKFIRHNTPVASSLWQTRAAFDRLVADQIQSFLDPEAEALWHAQQRRQERDYGTRTWWERGTMAPQRGPDLGNIIGGAS